MKKSRYALVGAVVIAAIVLSGCPNILGGFPLDPEERIERFIDVVDQDDPSIADIKAQFHPDAQEPGVIDETSWSQTVFDPDTRPFQFGPRSVDPENPDYPGSVTVTTEFESKAYSGRNALTVVFTLLPDPDNEDNWLIREIDPGTEAADIIRSVW
ncbi:MAG: hypothetical protein ACLFUA_10980 [Spirochaetales bacterium]